jgi:hypothetical protein
VIKVWVGSVIAFAVMVCAVPSAGASVAPIVRPRLHAGMQGAEVAYVQRRLTALHYVPGQTGGWFEQPTVAAVWAFQKVNGLAPTGVVDRRTWRALARPRRPHRVVHSRARTRVEVDLTRRLVVAYDRGHVALISHASPGRGTRYCVDGQCARAVTPRGDVRVYKKLRYWHRSRLGLMYDAVYFHGGFSFHGSYDVPLRAASHGCVRLPMPVAARLFHLVKRGEPVFLRHPSHR